MDKIDKKLAKIQKYKILCLEGSPGYVIKQLNMFKKDTFGDIKYKHTNIPIDVPYVKLYVIGVERYKFISFFTRKKYYKFMKFYFHIDSSSKESREYERLFCSEYKIYCECYADRFDTKNNPEYTWGNIVAFEKVDDAYYMIGLLMKKQYQEIKIGQVTEI